MAKHGEPLREKFCVLIASGRTIAASSREAGVTPRTGKRWMKEPAVKADVARLRAEMTDRALGALSEAASEAVRTLVEMLDERRPDTVRLAAARAILASLLDIRVNVELAKRVAALEAAQGHGQAKGRWPA